MGKAGLKLNIEKKNDHGIPPHCFMANRGGKVEMVTDFLFLGSKICSHKIRRQLLLGRKAMTNLDSVLKNKDVTLPTKVHIVKAVVFPVGMYGCETGA